MGTFSILQWNARGIANKIEDILNTFNDDLPDIICVQETNLLKHQYFNQDNYKTVLRFGERKSKKEGIGKGLLIAIKNNHTGWVINKQNNNQAQILSATIFLNNKYQIKVTNLYRKCNNFSKKEGELFTKMIKN